MGSRSVGMAEEPHQCDDGDRVDAARRDSIHDTTLLWGGTLPQLFDLSRAPSTIGFWLRDFRWHNVRQLDAFCRESLSRQWAASARPAGLSAQLTIDLDSIIVAVFRRRKQGSEGWIRT
jgi:hypothetical protein